MRVRAKPSYPAHFANPILQSNSTLLISINSRRPSHLLLQSTLCLILFKAFGVNGAVPFFFVELDPQWARICNGMVAGVMLAASFDLIQEGQGHGASN
ncbi:hypothetical protein Q3G72_020094 [Acer saccharum]|nr:hypothetical protein Q3G72_020094 [Acer saccharum]